MPPFAPTRPRGAGTRLSPSFVLGRRLLAASLNSHFEHPAAIQIVMEWRIP
jgi:hypothetical protein